MVKEGRKGKKGKREVTKDKKPTMSLFSSCDWWNSPSYPQETFHDGSLLVDNLDNASQKTGFERPFLSLVLVLVCLNCPLFVCFVKTKS